MCTHQATMANGRNHVPACSRHDHYRRRPGQDHERARERRGQHRRADSCVQGHSLRGRSRRRPAMERATAGAALERRTGRLGIRRAVHPRTDFRGHHVSEAGERRLPQPEHLDAGGSTGRSAARDGVDSRRRVPGRRRPRAPARWRRAGAQRRRGRHDQLPAGHLWILCASRSSRRSRAATPRATTACSIKSPRCAGFRRTLRPSAAIRRT